VEIKINETAMTKKLINVNTSVTVSHRIGEAPWWSSCQPTAFITLCEVLRKQWLVIKCKSKQTNMDKNK